MMTATGKLMVTLRPGEWQCACSTVSIRAASCDRCEGCGMTRPGDTAPLVKMIVPIDEAMAALETFEYHEGRGQGRLYAIQMVLLEDRERRR